MAAKLRSAHYLCTMIATMEWTKLVVLCIFFYLKLYAGIILIALGRHTCIKNEMVKTSVIHLSTSHSTNVHVIGLKASSLHLKPGANERILLRQLPQMAVFFGVPNFSE